MVRERRVNSSVRRVAGALPMGRADRAHPEIVSAVDVRVLRTPTDVISRLVGEFPPLHYVAQGLQCDGPDYLAQMDVRLTKAADVPVQIVDVNSVVDAFMAAGSIGVSSTIG